MISDLDLVRACQATYHQDTPSLPMPATGVFCCVSRGADGRKIIAFRGSVTVEDWVRDFCFTPIAVREHPELGHCHAGFLDAAESIADEIGAEVGNDPYVLTGHSLGGAEATGVGALMQAKGHPPDTIVTFGCPRFGMWDFVTFMSPLEIRQYRRGNDIVPEVPRDVLPDFQFLDTRVQIPIGVAALDFLSCHHIDGYVADVASRI